MREFAGDANFVDPAALMADPTRARILLSLLDRRSLAMSELAVEAGVAQSTVSAHLARLVDGELLTVRSEGRHRYYSLASADVATALECLARLSPPFRPNSLRSHRRSSSLKAARTCYDHAAGDLGVTVMEGLLDRGAIARTGRGPTAYRITPPAGTCSAPSTSPSTAPRARPPRSATASTGRATRTTSRAGSERPSCPRSWPTTG
ncbi:ArsR/SmtB family transcription factor [Streptomyces sp. UC4497]